MCITNIPYPLQYTTRLELSAHLVEIAIEYAFLGQTSSFWVIFTKFELSAPQKVILENRMRELY